MEDSQQINQYEEEEAVFMNLTDLGSGCDRRPFISLTKLIPNRIFIIEKIYQREKGRDNSQYDSVILETKNFRTALPQRFIDEMKNNDQAFEVFKVKARFFRFDDQKSGINGRNGLAMISFPHPSYPNGCHCLANECAEYYTNFFKYIIFPFL